MNETKGHIDRLERIFDIMDEKATATHCSGIEGILKEGEELLSEHAKGLVKDAAIIAETQKVEHYEIGCYGTARAHAKELDMTEIAEILKETLDEEINADKMLSKLAQGSMFSGGLNTQAVSGREQS
jgi:ferritin-like metal-binding protein YciE